MISKQDDKKNSNESIIELEPFIHQVGGRSAILALGDCICKPINEREYSFYETLDQFAPLLKPFVPTYNGTISVHFEECKDGYLVITTKSSKNLFDSSTTSNTHETSQSIGGSLRIHSPSSPYQKFITKYRIRLCRPLKEVIIESHEHNVENDVAEDLESSKKRLETLFLKDKVKHEERYSRSNSFLRTNSISNNANVSPTNLIRSRSTSISIPNFEDGNFFNQPELTNLFDNTLFTNEAEKRNLAKLNDQTASPMVSSQSYDSSPQKRIIYTSSTTKHNPWVLKTFSSLIEFNDSMKEQKFILLENLVAKFQYPCIIDLKMGTRLHDDNATQVKKESHESKVNETTSGALGLRITAIQTYDKDLDRFICYNKYYGRKLTPEGFRTSLKSFVSTENFSKYNLLDELIEKLKQLRSVIIKLDTFRFYTSSLLIIYEGNTCDCPTGDDDVAAASAGNDEEFINECDMIHDIDRMLDIRLIDFAHSTHSQINASSLSSSGNNNNITNNNNSNSSSSSTASAAANANNSSQGYDEGLVFGLDNLIKIFTLFKNNA